MVRFHPVDVDVINPFDYLKDLLSRLPAARIPQIKGFTPAAWAEANAKEKATRSSRFNKSASAQTWASVFNF
jgi:hypothetical protein